MAIRLLAVLCLFLPAVAHAVDLGWTDDYRSQWDLGDGDIEAQYIGISVTMPPGGPGAYQAESLWVYVLETGAPNVHDLRGAIYDSSNNKLPNGDTDNYNSVGTSYGWHELPFSTPPSLDGDTDYTFLVGVSGGGGTVWIRGGFSFGDCSAPPPGVNCGAPQDSSPTALPPSALDDPHGAAGNEGRTVGIYMEYSVVASGPSMPILRKRGR